MRYAMYYAPERDDPLWKAGCAWLGRDPESGEAAPPHGGDDLVGDAARYGFHATLKPPFSLAAGADEADLDAALARFAASRAADAMPELSVQALHGFLALRPENDAASLRRLAAACVEEFDAFRRPSSAAEIGMRRSKGLTPAQDAHLVRWGYPYVFGEYRFHMTLTKRLNDDARAHWLPMLEDRFEAALRLPRALSGVALFAEPAPGAPFKLLRRYRFGSH